MERDIFISYSRLDKEVVLPYVKQISEAVERECWIDLKGIESGVEFEEVIIKAIDECQVVLFMLSDSSLRSKWTKREVIYAEDEGKRIVPILVDGERLRGWFKFHFGNVDFIDIHSEEQKEKLITNLRAWLGGDEEKEDRVEREEDRRKAEKGTAKRNSQDSVLKRIITWARNFRFTGRHLAIIFIVTAILSFCGAFIVNQEFVQNHYKTIESFLISMMLASFCLAIIGCIRPSIVSLASRKAVFQFYLSSSFIFFFAFCTINSNRLSQDEPSKDNNDSTYLSLTQ